MVNQKSVENFVLSITNVSNQFIATLYLGNNAYNKSFNHSSTPDLFHTAY